MLSFTIQLPDSACRPARSTLGEVVSQFNQHRCRSPPTYLERMSSVVTGFLRRAVRGSTEETRLPLLHDQKYCVLPESQRAIPPSSQAALLKDTFTDFSYNDVDDGFTSISLESSPDVGAIADVANNNFTSNRQPSVHDLVTCESSKTEKLRRKWPRKSDNGMEMKELTNLFCITETKDTCRTTCFADSLTGGKRSNTGRNMSKDCNTLHRMSNWPAVKRCSNTARVAAVSSYMGHDVSDCSTDTCRSSSPHSDLLYSDSVTCLTWEEYIRLQRRSASCESLCGYGDAQVHRSLVDLRYASHREAFPPLKSRLCFSAMGSLCSEDIRERDLVTEGVCRVGGRGSEDREEELCELNQACGLYHGRDANSRVPCRKCRSLTQNQNSPPFWKSPAWEMRHKWDVPLLT